MMDTQQKLKTVGHTDFKLLFFLNVKTKMSQTFLYWLIE